MDNQIIELDGKKIIQYDNTKSIDFLDLIEFSNSLVDCCGVKQHFSPLYFFEYTKNKLFKEKNKKLFYLNSFLELPLNEDLPEEMKKIIGDFFGFEENLNNGNSYYQRFSKTNSYYKHHFNRYQTNRKTLEKEYVESGDVVIKININHLERTSENVLRVIKVFMNYRNALSSPSEIKFMREGCFGNINSKLWNTLIKEFEQENKIYVKRSPKGVICSIHLNDNNKTNNEKIMLKLESQGKLKNFLLIFKIHKNFIFMNYISLIFFLI